MMPRFRMLALAVTVALTVTGFAVAPVGAQDETPHPPTATPNPVPLDVPTGDGTAVRFVTDLGDIVIGLFTESAPVAAENFKNLAEMGFYNGTGFHRVVRDQIIQGGDPEGNGTGGPGYTIPDEQVVGTYGRGIVAMARTSQPNSQGSQFFIVLSDAVGPALAAVNTYVIFGRVIEGMDVVDAIAARGPESDLITDPVIIQSTSIEQVEMPPEPTPAPPTAAEQTAAKLVAQVPATIGDLPMQVSAVPTVQFLAAGSDDALAKLTDAVDANHGSLGDLAVVFGSGSNDAGDTFATILGASIPGVPAADIEEAMTALALQNIEGTVTEQGTFAGRDVTLIKANADAGIPDTIFVLASGDALWFVLGDEASVTAIFGALD